MFGDEPDLQLVAANDITYDQVVWAIAPPLAARRAMVRTSFNVYIAWPGVRWIIPSDQFLIAKETKDMHRRLLPILAVVVVAYVALGTVVAAPAGDELRIPAGFQRWYLVNSMIVTKDSPLFGAIGGLHLIYVNPVGFPRLKKGGSTPYPDGTIFTDDVRDVSLADGSYSQGSRKAIPVMVKDARK